MSNKKGFTLVEVIVVLVILAILAAVAIPTYTGYIDKSKRLVCDNNIATITRYYKYQRALDESSTLEGTLAGEYEECAADVAGIHCPSGGVYSVVGGKIVCSVHGGAGESDTDVSPTATGGSGSDPSPSSTVAAEIKVTSVTLDRTTMTLAPDNIGGMNGGPKTLVATVYPADATNQTVTWTSSNTAIATVDASGAVHFVHPGTAVITATTADGSKAASCTVNTQW